MKSKQLDPENLRTWEVDLQVVGPVSIERTISTKLRKGFDFDNPFYSHVEIRRSSAGLISTVTARAHDEESAYEAAVFFFGQMLDVLSLKVNCPLYISYTRESETRRLVRGSRIRQRIERDDFLDAFRESRWLSRSYAPFLRSLGWYRKGLATENPISKFLDFWVAIENLASQYHQHVPGMDMEKAKKGARNQIFGCFLGLWGPVDDWPHIASDASWIADSYRIRNDIAHGSLAIGYTRVAEVISRLQTMRDVCHAFVSGWRRSMLELCPPDVDENSADEELPLFYERNR